MKKINLITGASGFIAYELIESILKKKEYVLGIDKIKFLKKSLIKNKDFSFIQNDLSKYSPKMQLIINRFSKKNYKIYIWHFAANSDIKKGSKNFEIDYLDTFMTTKNILKYFENIKISKFIFASTSAVYGEHYKKIKEDTILTPISYYGSYKASSEMIIMTNSYLKNFEYHILRFPNVVGNGLTHGIIYDFLDKLNKNNRTLKVLGDGTQNKQYIHLNDLIKTIFSILKQSKKNNIINIGYPNDRGITVKKITEIFINKISPKTKIIYGKTKYGWAGDVNKFDYSTRKLQSLGINLKGSSLDAIKKTIGDLRK